MKSMLRTDPRCGAWRTTDSICSSTVVEASLLRLLPIVTCKQSLAGSFWSRQMLSSSAIFFPRTFKPPKDVSETEQKNE